MKMFRSISSLLILLSLVALCAGSIAAFGTTSNPAVGAPGYTPMVVQLAGSYSASTTSVVSWKAPTGYQIMNVSAAARASTGTNQTCKLRGKNGGFLNYTGSVVAGAVNDLSTVSSPSRMTDEGVQTVDLVLGGSSPVFTDITLFLFLKQL